MSRTAAIAYTTGGTVQAGGGVYVSRSADAELLQACREGVFAYVLTARQMGKSSLMTRTAEQLRAEGVQAIVVDLQAIGVNVTAEQWYLGILVAIEEQLMLDTDVIAWWTNQSELGLTQRFTRFFEQVLLQEVASQIVILIDEIDTVLSLDFTDDFFVAIRYFQVNRAQQSEFERLSFALFGVATPSDLIRDRQRTPFNIGRRIDLNDFTLEEAKPFADGLNLPRAIADQVLGWVLDWTGGHPYLTQRLCQVLVSEKQPSWTQAAIAHLVAATFFGDQCQQDNNLQFVRDMVLRRSPDLTATLETYRAIWNRLPVEDDPQSLVQAHLKLSGLIKCQGTTLTVRNAIYQQVFNRAWLRSHLPETRWERLKPALPLLATMLVATIGMAGVATYALHQRDRAATEAAIAKALRLSALIQNDRQQNLFSPTTILLAIETWNRLNALGLETADADEVLRSALPVTPRSLSPQWQGQNFVWNRDWTRLAIRSDPQTIRIVNPQTGEEQGRITGQTPINPMEFSPDGQYLVAIADNKVAKIYAVPTGKLIAQIPHTQFVHQASFSPDGRWIATASQDRTARISAVKTGKRIAQITHAAPVFAATFSPDGRFLATASWDKTARVSDARTGREISRIQHRAEVWDVAFSPDGRRLASGGSDRTLRISDRQTGQAILQLPYDASVSGVVFSPDGQRLAIRSATQTDILNAQTGQRITTMRHDDQVNAIAFSPDGRWLATASNDKTARISDAQTGRTLAAIAHADPVQRIAFSADGRQLVSSTNQSAWISAVQPHPLNAIQHGDQVNAVAFSADGRWVATASGDKTVQIRDLSTGNRITQITHAQGVNAVAFSPDGQFVATASDDQTARISAVQTGRQVLSLRHQAPVRHLSFSPDGRYLATASWDNTAQIYDRQTGRVQARIPHRDWVNAVTFSPDGRYVATASRDFTVRISAVPTGRQVVSLPHQDPLWQVAFSPDGRYLAAGTSGNTVKIFAVPTGQRIAEIPHQASVWRVAFSPDSQSIATASSDKTARVSEVASGKPVRTIAHENQVTVVGFSPDGTMLIRASQDRTARISDVTTGRAIARIRHRGVVVTAGFSPDGQWVATGSADGQVQVSPVRATDLIAAACQLVPANLSPMAWRQSFGAEPYRATCPKLPPAPDSSVSETPSEK